MTVRFDIILGTIPAILVGNWEGEVIEQKSKILWPESNWLHPYKEYGGDAF